MAKAFRLQAEPDQRPDPVLEQDEALSGIRVALGSLLPQPDGGGAPHQGGGQRKPADAAADDRDIHMAGRVRHCLATFGFRPGECHHVCSVERLAVNREPVSTWRSPVTG